MRTKLIQTPRNSLRQRRLLACSSASIAWMSAAALAASPTSGRTRCKRTVTARIKLKRMKLSAEAGCTWLEDSACMRYAYWVSGNDLYRLAEQKRAIAEEMRRVASTLWLCADRARVMRRAAELETESKWMVLDAAAAVAALLSQPKRQAAQGEEKGKS